MSAVGYVDKTKLNYFWTKVKNYVDTHGGGGSPLDAYPVGAIYLSVNSTSPATLFGGTWSRIEDKFLLSAGSTYTAGSTGGSADAVIVRHSHTPSNSKGFVTVDSVGGSKVTKGSTSTNYYMHTGSSDASWRNANTNTVGESGTGKNMPPYLSVYVWQRTA